MSNDIDLTTIQWEADPGKGLNFKVLAEIPPRAMEPRALMKLDNVGISVKYDPEDVNRFMEKLEQDVTIRYASKTFLFPLGKRWCVIDSEIKFKGYLSKFTPITEPDKDGIVEVSCEIEVTTPCA